MHKICQFYFNLRYLILDFLILRVVINALAPQSNIAIILAQKGISDWECCHIPVLKRVILKHLFKSSFRSATYGNLRLLTLLYETLTMSGLLRLALIHHQHITFAILADSI